MINFNKNSVWNLKPIDVSAVRSEVTGLLVSGEEIVCAFKTIRDQLVFTNKRIISIDVQGITGTKKSFSSLPYSKVQFFAIQTPGIMEMVPDAELFLMLVQNKHSTRSANEGSDAMLIFVIMGGQWMDGFFDEPSVRAVNSPPPSCYKDSIEQVAPAMPRARHEPI